MKKPHFTVTKYNTPAILTTRLRLGKGKNCIMNVTSHSNNKYILQGCRLTSKNPYQEHYKLAIRNPIKAASFFITRAFKKNNITITHTPKISYLKANATLVGIHQSPKLSVLIHKMLKESDNVIANSLLKTMGRKYSKSLGGWNNGVTAMTHILSKKTPIKPSSLKLEDGAGLSRYNLLTAHSVYQLLLTIENNPKLKAYIIPALPVAGKDGTLLYRLTKLKKVGSLQAKTGSMTGVSNIAGYLHTKHNKNMIVVIMSDRFRSKVKAIRKWEDNLITQLAMNY